MKMISLSKKLKATGGFTLTETLATVVIVGLLSLALAMGIQFGVKGYNQSMTLSEGQTLCSTLSNAIQNELRYAIPTDSNASSFTSPSFGDMPDGTTTTSEAKTAAGFTLDRNSDGEITLNGSKMVSSTAYSQGNKATIKAFTYDSSTHIFHVKIVVDNSLGDNLITNEFEVKPINVK